MPSCHLGATKSNGRHGRAQTSKTNLFLVHDLFRDNLVKEFYPKARNI
jgi:hypothetical protein